jgi:hypothetical protein
MPYSRRCDSHNHPFGWIFVDMEVCAHGVGDCRFDYHYVIIQDWQEKKEIEKYGK